MRRAKKSYLTDTSDRLIRTGSTWGRDGAAKDTVRVLARSSYRMDVGGTGVCCCKQEGDVAVEVSSLHETGVPFNIDVQAKVNQTRFTIVGQGAVPVTGVYQGELEFSAMPPRFHPAVVSAYVYSICCYMLAATRNDARNMADMGVDAYDTRRVLGFPDGDSIEIVGKVERDRGAFGFAGEMSGSVAVPDDITGHSFYTTFLQGEGSRRIVGRGEGSCFREGGGGFPVRIETVHTFHKGESLAKPQFRLVTDHGILDGLRYSFSLHSILDTVNAMLNVSSQSGDLGPVTRRR